ncbi:MAG: polyhydroxyalkanoate synthesis repressor PhaR [Rhodospirillaceae bacterium]|nr:MAG: polyhydroxyalkanoate synthesis repressor PhaR [Rhodospirillaceae bacterium]
MAEHSDGAPSVVTIKKYANRRLYNTATSSYVTLDHLAEMVKKGVDFVVTDAKSGEDITRGVLTQIIVEQEGKGQNLLPIKFLRQIIGFYGDALGGLVPRYLESSMSAFTDNEGNMRNILQDTFKGLLPVQQMEEMGKQNMALFQNAMRMFNPFAQMNRNTPAGTAYPGQNESNPGDTAKGPDIEPLKAQISQMQSQLEKLLKERS